MLILARDERDEHNVIRIVHNSETLLIRLLDNQRGKVRLALTGPISFEIMRGELIPMDDRTWEQRRLENASK